MHINLHPSRPPRARRRRSPFVPRVLSLLDRAGFWVQGSGSLRESASVRKEAQQSLQPQPTAINIWTLSTPECWRGSIHSKACQDTLLTFENLCLEEEVPFGDPFEDSVVAACSRWSSNPSGKCLYERPTRGTVSGTMRSMCGADADRLAINNQSLWTLCSSGRQAVRRQSKSSLCIWLPHHPARNPGANRWFLWSNPIQMRA